MSPDRSRQAPQTGAPLRGAASALLLLTFFLVRLAYLSRATIWTDEAVFGLMALEIGQGREFPLYCWGAHYASALISYIAVPVMAALGVNAFAFKAATLPWSIGLLLLVFHAIRREAGTLVGALAALLVAVPLPTLLHYGTAAHGGYPETYCLGIAIWIVTLDLVAAPARGKYFLLGLLGGLSFSILWLGLPFIGSALALLALRRMLLRREAWAGAGGALLGLLPILYYNLVIAPGATVLRLGGRSLEATAKAALLPSLMNRITGLPRWFSESHSGLSLLFSAQGGWLALLVLAGASAWGLHRLRRTRCDWFVLLCSFLGCLLLFNLAGNLTRDRMWSTLFFAMLAAIAVPAATGRGRSAAIAILSILLLTNAFAVKSEIEKLRPDAQLIGLARRVRAEKPDALVADYELAYSTAFLAGGGMLVSAVAPPLPNDRRPDWTERIAGAGRTAVILPPRQAGTFESKLAESKISFREEMIESRVLFFVEGNGDTVLAFIRALE